MKASVLRVEFDRVTMQQAVGWALKQTKARMGAYVCTPNPEIVWACRSDEALRSAVAQADMTLADGVGIVWASRMLKCAVPERVSGYDFLLALLAEMQGTVYILGGSPGVAAQAGQKIEQQFPNVVVCGTQHGYFEDDAEIVNDIQEKAPDLLLVCLGSPKQEIWMQAHRGSLPVGLMAGLGGCLDVLSGQKKRAPDIWIRMHLEWLYRLLCEPRRIKRQLRLPLFALAVIKERWRPWKAEN